MNWTPSTSAAANILDTVPEAYVCVDSDFRYTFLNRAAEQLLGKSRANLLGKVLWEVYPELGGTLFEDGCRRAMAERVPVAFEDYYGQWQRWYATSATPDSEGGITLRAVDITERKRDEELLRGSEAEFRDLFDSAPVAYHELDIDGMVRRVNRAECALLGYEAGDMLGRPIWEFISGADREASRETFRRKLSGERPLQPYQRNYLRRDGGDLWVEVHDVLVRGEKGEVIGIRTALLDITARKRAEAYREVDREVLQILNEPGDLRDAIQRVLAALNTLTKCDAIGMRLQDGEDFPYFAQEGFSEDFLLTENTLIERGADGGVCRDNDGAVRLECTCGLVLSGKTNPANSLFTRGGSCWVNDSFPLLDLPPAEDPRLNPRNECIHHGYASVALVPIRSQDRIVGLIHLNDRRKGRFTLDTIELLEGIAAHVGEALMRKRTEEARRESEGRFAAFMTHLPAAAFVKDEDGRILFANQYVQELPGFKNWEGETTRNLLAGEVGRQMEEDDRKVLSQGPLKVQETIVDSHGSSRIFETNKFPIRLGRTTLLGGISIDITERQEMETALREAEAKFRALFLNGPDALYLASLEEGKICDINRLFELLFGYSSSEAIGETSLHLGLYANPADRARMIAELKANGKVTDFETEGRRKNGEFFPCSLSVVSMMLDGEPRIAGAIRDLTERKRLDAEREKLSGQLAQAQKMESVGRLAGGVAHDFNNLLTVINGYSQMVLENLKAGDPFRGSLEEIHKAGKRAEGLTRQLLAFSRKQILEPRRLDVNRVVAEMQPMLERLVGEDIEVRVALHAEGGTIHADPHQLEQVVMNLVVNARDAMPGVGRLLVETANAERDESYARSHPEARAGRYVMLAVSDTGVGMDEETKRRIFEPFFTTKPIGKGTGLGLAMVQGIVVQSGGYVEVYSEKGEGTTFKIYLPALDEAATAGFPASADPVTGGKETVLVVEDQAEVLTYTVAVLKEYGYRVIPAGTAGEALLLCEQEHIDLLLTDVVMPNLGGRELAERLEELQPGIKVLFMSGYTADAIVQRGVLEHNAQFIQKPFNPEALAGKVRAILGPAGPLARILVADDDTGVRTFLRKVLEDSGYEVIEAADGKQALKQARAGHVNLVITDLCQRRNKTAAFSPAL